MYIPIYEPTLAGNEHKYVVDCLNTNWISSKGAYIPKFEELFSEYTQIANSIACSNGTVALHLAMLALSIGHGDEVIVPSFTYVATINCIKYVNATPVFVDCERDTWQIDADLIENLITNKTKAILVTHLYGGACNIYKIMEIAQKFNLFVVEDCAEALGTYFNQKHVGTFGHISTFSFFGNKTITTGEGGMVCTNNEQLASKIKKIKSQGVSPDKIYWHDVIGYNYRMTNICAAIGCAQMEQVKFFLENKREIANFYKKNLKDLPVLFQSTNPHSTHSWWMFSILLENNKTRDLVASNLLSHGIETRPTFYPVHTMPMYCDNQLSLPVTEDISNRGLNLPSSPNLTHTKLNYIINAINNIFHK